MSPFSSLLALSALVGISLAQKGAAVPPRFALAVAAAGGQVSANSGRCQRAGQTCLDCTTMLMCVDKGDGKPLLDLGTVTCRPGTFCTSTGHAAECQPGPLPLMCDKNKTFVCSSTSNQRQLFTSFPNLLDSSKYYVCAGDSMVEIQCPDGRFFNADVDAASTKVCAEDARLKGAVDCNSDNTQAFKVQGLKLGGADSRLYYQCKNTGLKGKMEVTKNDVTSLVDVDRYDIQLYSCPPDLIFDSEQYKCVTPNPPTP